MEAGGAGGRRLAVGRVEASPERGRPAAYASAGRPAPARPMRRVQIIYYLCRNGQLEHPHFMELAQHPHQPLRLKGMSSTVWRSVELASSSCMSFLSLLSSPLLSFLYQGSC
jgi:hypothetical protein